MSKEGQRTFLEQVRQTLETTQATRRQFLFASLYAVLLGVTQSSRILKWLNVHESVFKTAQAQEDERTHAELSHEQLGTARRISPEEFTELYRAVQEEITAVDEVRAASGEVPFDLFHRPLWTVQSAVAETADGEKIENPDTETAAAARSITYQFENTTGFVFGPEQLQSVQVEVSRTTLKEISAPAKVVTEFTVHREMYKEKDPFDQSRMRYTDPRTEEEKIEMESWGYDQWQELGDATEIQELTITLPQPKNPQHAPQKLRIYYVVQTDRRVMPDFLGSGFGLEGTIHEDETHRWIHPDVQAVATQALNYLVPYFANEPAVQAIGLGHSNKYAYFNAQPSDFLWCFTPKTYAAGNPLSSNYERHSLQNFGQLLYTIANSYIVIDDDSQQFQYRNQLYPIDQLGVVLKEHEFDSRLRYKFGTEIEYQFALSAFQNDVGMNDDWTEGTDQLLALLRDLQNEGAQYTFTQSFPGLRFHPVSNNSAETWEWMLGAAQHEGVHAEQPLTDNILSESQAAYGEVASSTCHVGDQMQWLITFLQTVNTDPGTIQTITAELYNWNEMQHATTLQTIVYLYQKQLPVGGQLLAALQTVLARKRYLQRVVEWQATANFSPEGVRNTLSYNYHLQIWLYRLAAQLHRDGQTADTDFQHQLGDMNIHINDSDAQLRVTTHGERLYPSTAPIPTDTVLTKLFADTSTSFPGINESLIAMLKAGYDPEDPPLTWEQGIDDTFAQTLLAFAAEQAQAQVTQHTTEQLTLVDGVAVQERTIAAVMPTEYSSYLPVQLTWQHMGVTLPETGVATICSCTSSVPFSHFLVYIKFPNVSEMLAYTPAADQLEIDMVDVAIQHGIALKAGDIVQVLVVNDSRQDYPFVDTQNSSHDNWPVATLGLQVKHSILPHGTIPPAPSPTPTEVPTNSQEQEEPKSKTIYLPLIRR